jgi:hypothetical protein
MEGNARTWWLTRRPIVLAVGDQAVNFFQGCSD